MKIDKKTIFLILSIIIITDFNKMSKKKIQPSKALFLCQLKTCCDSKLAENFDRNENLPKIKKLNILNPKKFV